jgi:catechol-2,3-dioxygenase
MTRTLAAALFTLLLLAPASTASAQLVAEGPVVYGHHHLTVSDVAAHQRFWAETLGGTPGTFGGNTPTVAFPNVIVFFRAQAPTGGSVGSTSDHIGHSVQNLRQVGDRVKANGFRMITQGSAPPTLEVVDDIARVNADTAIAFALGPDDVKVELLEDRTQTEPAKLHHVHFFGHQNAEMQAWYAKVFGAETRPAPGAFLSSGLPGVVLNFSQSAEPMAATRGRVVDHIGFEIDGLEAFTKKLVGMGITLDVPYRSVPAIGLSIAFITDPWGTYIELTEGLDELE